ncbi:NAD(+)/NADH kinase, partial [candidate division WOR-3 bacterium]|nr:NAD(+)/NADH kinase [candidate division WOR-3 bacterium]
MRIGLVVNRAKPLARRFVPGLCRWLRSRGHEPVLATSTARAFKVDVESMPSARLVHRVDLVVALGGDGTLLRAARLVGPREVPVMGVNLGGLGFLTEFSLAEARAGIADFTRGRHREERRIVLTCRSGRRAGIALNDCALNMGPAGRVVEVVVRSGRTFVNRFVGDGIVVATPTGSTAYSLAAGGPVVYPTMSALLLTPLCPHALAARPLVLPGDAAVELQLSRRSDSAMLNLDGQERWPLRPGGSVAVRVADFAVRLVAPRSKTYFQILRDKMKWSG